MKVGVLALQGDVREHIKALGECGVHPFPVRRASEIEKVDALILPGVSPQLSHFLLKVLVFLS